MIVAGKHGRVLLIVALILAAMFLVCRSPVFADGESGGVDDDSMLVWNNERERREPTSGKSHRPASKRGGELPKYSVIGQPASIKGWQTCKYDKVGRAVSCRATRRSCEATADVDFSSGDAVATPLRGPVVAEEGKQTRRYTRHDRLTGAETDLGHRCVTSGISVPGVNSHAPVVVTVSREEFARLPVKPLEVTVGPPGGWLPVNMDNVLQADPQTQMLETTLLGTPVAIRAVPISYHWDLGDGNTITTKKPGKAYPDHDVASRYMNEGWYDVTLTTTFAGQFSVDGGEWQDIDGTIEIASDPVAIFSKSLQARLTNPFDTPMDQEPRNVGFDPETDIVPARTPETEGPIDENATHRDI